MTTSTYDPDFYTWTQQQAAALRAKESKTLDWDHLAEEIKDGLGPMPTNRHYAKSRG